MTESRVPRVLVAIPAFNEEASLANVIRDVRTANPAFDLLVVDDGSTDGTAAVARSAGVTLCRLPFNLGVGGAMRTAFRYAELNDYDAMVQVDADGQHDPRAIAGLLTGLQEADVVVGARFAGEACYEVSIIRRSAMWLLSKTVSRFAGHPLTDVTSGFRASNRRAIRVFARHYPCEYLGDTVESLVIAMRTGLVVRQVPVRMSPRLTGHPSQSLARATTYLLRTSCALLLARLRQWPVLEGEMHAETAISGGRR